MIEYGGTAHWGMPSMIHFFLVGVGGGTLAISSFLILLGESRGGNLFSIARYAGLIAPIAILDDAAVLIGELGHPARFLNIFTHVNFASPMWVGAWLLVLFIVVSLAFAFTYLALPERRGILRSVMARLGVPARVGPKVGWCRMRWFLAWLGLPLGIALCHYPGFMLTALEARPFWNTALLPLVFLLSGLATALASILLCRIFFRATPDVTVAREYRHNNDLLVLAIFVVLIAEAFVVSQVVVFAYHSNTVLERITATVIMPGGLFAAEFWIGVVVIGLALPIVAALITVIPRLGVARQFILRRPLEAVMPSSVIFGSFMLNKVLLFGGQLTGPVGI